MAKEGSFLHTSPVTRIQHEAAKGGWLRNPPGPALFVQKLGVPVFWSTSNAAGLPGKQQRIDGGGVPVRLWLPARHLSTSGPANLLGKLHLWVELAPWLPVMPRVLSPAAVHDPEPYLSRG